MAVLDDEWRATRWQRKWQGYELTVLRLDSKMYEWGVRFGDKDEMLIRVGSQPSLPVAMERAQDEALADAQARRSVPLGDYP